MLERPKIPDREILACVRTHYTMPAHQIEFLPIGYDSNAWVYAVRDEDGQNSAFVKLKRGDVKLASLTVPRLLHDMGITAVVAPIRNRDSLLITPLNELGEFSVMVYPYIDGKNGYDYGMSKSDWVAFGSVLKQVHKMTLPFDIAAHVQTEKFTLNPKWLDIVRQLQRDVLTTDYDDPHQSALAAIWKQHHDLIGKITERAVALGLAMQQQHNPKVLCHADIHVFNLMFDELGQLHIVDWDEVIDAPKERDLMFIIDNDAGEGSVNDENAQSFIDGYTDGFGAAALNIDPVAMAYYRYEWVVQELGGFGERVFFMDDVGEVTRADSVREFEKLFAPGDVVEAALRSESNLPPGV